MGNKKKSKGAVDILRNKWVLQKWGFCDFEKSESKILITTGLKK